MDKDESDVLEKNNINSSKKSRHRKKQKYNEIRKQMEFYFSDSNLTKDRFLKQLIVKDPSVPLETFLSFNKMKQFTDSAKDIATALENSTLLKLSDDKTSVCRTTEVKLKEDLDEYIIYVESLPPNVDHEWIQNTFSVFGPIAYISLPRYRHTKKIKEFAFIEFEHKSSVQKAIDAFEEFGGLITSEKNPDELMSIVSYIKEENETKEINKPFEEEMAPDQSGNDVDEQPPAKKVKFIEQPPLTDETVKDEDSKADSDDNDMKNEEPECNADKQKRKRIRKKKAGIVPPVVSTDTNSSITDLRITTKLTWKRLRNKYLNLQREKFKQIKQNLRNDIANKKTPQHSVNKSLKSTRNINFYGALNETDKKTNGDAEEKKSKEIDILTKSPLFLYEPGIIVNIKFGQPCVDVKDFKAEMRQYSQVKYVDVKEGSCEAFIRLDAPKSAEIFMKQCSDPNYQFGVLTGEDEKNYWGKIKKDREDKLLKKVKIKPNEKFVGKIINKSSIHIRFDDD